MSAAFTVRILLTGAIDGVTPLPPASGLSIVTDPNLDLITIQAANGNPLGNVGRISLAALQGILGFPSGLISALMVVDPAATIAGASSAPNGETQRWSPVRSWTPNAGGDAFMPNTVPVLSSSDELIVSTNGGALPVNREIVFQVIPAPAAEVLKMCAAQFLFAPDTGNTLQIESVGGWLPPTSQSAPIAAPQALELQKFNIYDTAGGAFGVTVAAAAPGGLFGVKNVPGGSANGLTITPAAGLIENLAGALGATAVIASATAAAVWMATDAGNWLIASRA